MNSLNINSSGFLYGFLFHLRTPLGSISSASDIAKRWAEKIPIGMIDWLEKWSPAVDKWISDEEKAHLFLKDGKDHDREQVVHEMAENMKDLAIALDEAKELEMPESTEGKMVYELAVHGVEYLNKIVQPIRNRDYQSLL